MVTLEQVLKEFPRAQTYWPGGSEAPNAEIIGLIRSGTKTVSCEAWSVFEDGSEPLPETGRVDVALDWDGHPACATQTVKVEKIRFCDMPETLIPPEGEFRELAHWRAGYEGYLIRAGRFHDEVPMMVETFRLIRDYGEAGDV